MPYKHQSTHHFAAYSVAPENLAATLATLASDYNLPKYTLNAVCVDSSATAESVIAHLQSGYYTDQPERAAVYIFNDSDELLSAFYTDKHFAEYFHTIASPDDDSRLVYVQHIGCDTIAISQFAP